MSKRTLRAALGLLTLFALTGAAARSQPAPAGMGAPAPATAIKLFSGSDVSLWQKRGSTEPIGWAVDGGELKVQPGAGDIVTKRKFGDYQLHLEFNIPDLPDRHSQERGNSGVYQQGLYEIQVLDSFNNETYAHGMCGAIYGQRDPDINACRHAGEWQSYDIFFRAPRFDAAGAVAQNPHITVFHNGILIHNNAEITGPTLAGLGGPMTPTGPLMLQDHGSEVRYRNIWILPQHFPAGSIQAHPNPD